jgi:hypothetical protein
MKSLSCLFGMVVAGVGIYALLHLLLGAIMLFIYFPDMHFHSWHLLE